MNISYDFDEQIGLKLTPDTKIGLAPIKNPYGGKTYGNISIKPRIGWIDIFNILEDIEWKINPAILKDEEPIASEGILPKWYRALETLEAIDIAASANYLKYFTKQTQTNLPKGNIDWDDYVNNKLSHGKHNTFKIEQSEHTLNHALNRQLKGVVNIIEEDIIYNQVPPKIKNKARILNKSIRKKWSTVISNTPKIEELNKIDIPAFYQNNYKKAIENSIKYLSENKFGLISSNNFGMPWNIKMDELFETWIAYHSIQIGKNIGAQVYTNFKKNSNIKFINLDNWKSLKTLKPDIILEKDNKTMIIDVKYKKHLQYLNSSKLTNDTLDEHRKDIHQILAYLAASSKKNRMAVLLYPSLGINRAEASKIINYSNTDMNTKVVLLSCDFNKINLYNLLIEMWKNMATKTQHAV